MRRESNKLIGPHCLFLGGRVVNFTKEVFFLIVLSVLLQPEIQDEPVSNEQDAEKTQIVNTEPFACSFGRHKGSAGHERFGNLWHDIQCGGSLGNAKGDCRTMIDT